MNQIEQELKKVSDHISVIGIKNISLVSIEKQLKLFTSGVKTPKIEKPCKLGDGIVELKKDDFEDLLSLFDSASSDGRLIKFVPASGAASRMFTKLQSVLNRFNNFTLDDLKKHSDNDNECKSVLEFLINLSKFAFYDDLKNILVVDDYGIKKLINESPAEILDAVLYEKGLNYLSKPKGAIKFHRYKNECRTAFEEHVYEAFHYISDNNRNSKIHFTISEEHTELFNKIVNDLKSNLTNSYLLDVLYSYQKKSTDTIAVDLENKLIFDKSGNLVLRPGGHGALLENLNDLKADIVIIKNIDNLSTAVLASDTILFKKLLIGYLVKIQNRIFELLHILDKDGYDNNGFNEIFKLSEKELFITRPLGFELLSDEQKKKFLYDKLNRPIRVCGMVKNIGEPGGGPFWVREDDGSLSLQIIEQAQINMNDENQKNIFKQSTHFNPVDLICGLKNYKGNNFDLHKYVDHQSGIITKKSKDGIELKALELPGLWNGSMANWITIFVEVPRSTFNPVKEVNDLLRKRTPELIFNKEQLLYLIMEKKFNEEILNSLAEGVLTVDKNFKISFFNRAAELITGFQKDEVIGQFCKYVFKCELCQTQCPIGLVLESGNDIYEYNSSIEVKTGARKPIRLNAAILKNSDNEPVGGVISFRDLSELMKLRRETISPSNFYGIIGHSKSMQEIFGLIEEIAESDATVLIQGESGTGKELVANAIQATSLRKGKQFLKVNCSVFPQNLLASELFGHVKGAYTDAFKDRPGRFELADGGTLFLDEVAEMPLQTQIQLLRILQEGTFERVGESVTRKTDVRVISATNINIKKSLEDGKLREDLFYRLNVIPIYVPALRERREDIPYLIKHFIEDYSKIYKKDVNDIDDDALEVFMNYNWPGNVRELENAIEYLIVRRKDSKNISFNNLPSSFKNNPSIQHPEAVQEVRNDNTSQLVKLLEKHHWNKTKVAQELGIGRTTLWRMLKNFSQKQDD